MKVVRAVFIPASGSAVGLPTAIRLAAKAVTNFVQGQPGWLQALPPGWRLNRWLQVQALATLRLSAVVFIFSFMNLCSARCQFSPASRVLPEFSHSK